MIKEKLSEAELAMKFIKWFQPNYEIFCEVPGYGIIDFVATNSKIRIAVEVKTSLNFDVIEQAFKNTMYCHYSYVAVPYSTNRHFQYKICKQYGLGVIEYESFDVNRGFVYEKLKPKLHRNVNELKLKDWMKRSVAGSKNDRMTAFKFTCEQIAEILKSNGGKIKAKDFFQNNHFHYNHASSAIQCLSKLCNSGVIKEFYFENGNIILTDAKP